MLIPSTINITFNQRCATTIHVTAHQCPGIGRDEAVLVFAPEMKTGAVRWERWIDQGVCTGTRTNIRLKFIQTNRRRQRDEKKDEREKEWSFDGARRRITSRSYALLLISRIRTRTNAYTIYIRIRSSDYSFFCVRQSLQMWSKFVMNRIYIMKVERKPFVFGIYYDYMNTMHAHNPQRQSQRPDLWYCAIAEIGINHIHWDEIATAKGRGLREWSVLLTKDADEVNETNIPGTTAFVRFLHNSSPNVVARER